MANVTNPADQRPRFVRADGPEKVTGSALYAADLQMAGMLAAKFLLAETAHARIVRLDVTEARRVPGVFAVLTAADVPDVRYSAGVADRTLFARDVVRFEGEVVAAVAAVTAEAARTAINAIIVDYEPLAIVDDPERARADEAPLVHPDWAGYTSDAGLSRHGNIAAFSSIARGDVDAGMAQADVVVTGRYVADGSHAVPIEPRAVVARWEGERVTIWTSSQVPFAARDGVCETLGLPTNRVRVIVPHLGGGFGGKCGFHFEAHVAALARAAGRPVKLVFTRREEFVAPDRRRESMIIEITTGVNNDGTIVARRGHVILDNGAYIADAAFFPQLAAMHVAGPYVIPNIEISAELVYTNHQPSGSVRAPTAPQTTWARESHTDEVAAAVGLDPVEFRLLNAVDTAKVGPTGQTYDKIGLIECIRRATDSAGWGRPLPPDEAIGVAIGWWPSFPVASGAYVKLDGDGAGQIITGAQECGTGSVMTLSQLAADELGMQPDDFQIVGQDTAIAPYDVGATGSQTLFNNGRAVVAAAGQIAEQLRDLAADRLEASAADIVLAGGVAHVAGTPDRNVSIADLAATAARGELLIGHGSGRPPTTPEISGTTCVGDQGLAAWAAPQFSCHAVRVKLDRDTGVVRVLEVDAVHDSGTIINHLGALGQVEGGVLMGVGQALSEGTVYGDGRQRNTTLLEYRLQTAADSPTVRTRFVEIATDGAGPRGAKGLAEAPNVATAGAVANAIARLTGEHLRRLPMTPERVWEVMG